MSRKTSSIENDSMTRRVGGADLLKRSRAPVKQRKSPGTQTRSGHFRSASATGSPVVTPYFFAGIDFCHDDPARGLRISGDAGRVSRRSRRSLLSRVLPPPTIRRHCSHPREISIVLPYCFPQKLSYCLVFSQFLIFRFIPVTLTDDSHVPNVNRTPY